jgi:hypothetical protein
LADLGEGMASALRLKDFFYRKGAKIREGSQREIIAYAFLQNLCVSFAPLR